MNIVIEALAKTHNRERFDCEEKSLNDFFKLYARQNDRKDLGKTFVAVLDGMPEVFGFYTISSGSVSFDIIPEKTPRYPVPVIHLGRLAVDKTARGEGLGRLLLFDALRRALRIAEELGIFAVEVYALNEQARTFYLKFGFRELGDDRMHLYITVRLIRKLIAI